MKNNFCSRCNKYVDLVIKTQMVTKHVKNAFYTFEEIYAECPNCGQDIILLEESNKILENLNKEIENGNGFYLGSKVYKIIENYNITAEEFSDLFNWDCKQWGIGMPRLKKDQINLFIREPMAFQFFLQANKSKISEESFNKVNTRLEKIISGEIDLNKEDDFDY